MKRYIKKILYLSVFYGLFVSNSFSIEPYIEGQFGVGIVEDVDGSTVIDATNGFNLSVNLTDLEYDNSLAFGGEFGVKDIIPNSNIRMALGITAFEAEFERGNVSAALNFAGSTLVSASGSFTAAEAASLGVTLTNDVRIFGLNTYLDLLADSTFVPYIGIGLGFADIENAEDNEFAASFMIGGNYRITDNSYIGAKGSYYNVLGPTDKAGIEYDDVNAWTFSMTLGIEF